jgi:alpha-glucosidase (family GH31 glycosyl hydrolase)
MFFINLNSLTYLNRGLLKYCPVIDLTSSIVRKLITKIIMKLKIKIIKRNGLILYGLALILAPVITYSQPDAWTEMAPGVWKYVVGIPEKTDLFNIAGVVPNKAALSGIGSAGFPLNRNEIKAETVNGQTYLRFPLKKGEQIFGFGLNFKTVQQRGKILHLHVDHYGGTDNGRTHSPVPFYVSDQGYGVFINSARYLTVYAGTGVRKDSPEAPEERDRNTDKQWTSSPYSDAVEILVPAGGVEIYVFAGPTALDAVRRFNLYQGGGCLPPRWGLGFTQRVPRLYTSAQVEQEAQGIFTGQLLTDQISIGISGYKIDECDGYDRWLWPDVATFPSGNSAEQIRQTYGLILQKITTDVYHQKNERTYGLVRASNGGGASFPYVIYNDYYSHEDFITALINSGFIGVLWTPEVRGSKTSEEWLRRMQTVIFSPMAMINAWSSGTKPWSFPEAEKEVREIAMLRMKLMPYFYTGKYVGNGEIISVTPGLDKIPVFVKDGGIIPMMTPSLHAPAAGQKFDIEIQYYGTSSGSYKLYDDDGETFDYEKGIYSWREIKVAPDKKGKLIGSLSKAEKGKPDNIGTVTWKFMSHE